MLAAPSPRPVNGLRDAWAPAPEREPEINMADVTYRTALGGPIVFVAQVPGFGPVEVKTSRKGIFSCRATDRRAREAALSAVEAFADEHEAELQVHYDEIAESWLTPRVA
jgi:hypothetical protein